MRPDSRAWLAASCCGWWLAGGGGGGGLGPGAQKGQAVAEPRPPRPKVPPQCPGAGTLGGADTSRWALTQLRPLVAAVVAGRTARSITNAVTRQETCAVRFK